MEFQIVWTNEAIETFDTIIEYIKLKFPNRYAINYINAVDAKINLIKNNPVSYRKS